MTLEKAAKPQKHLVRWILCALLVLVIALVAVVGVVWHNEISTLMSFKQLVPRDDAHQDGSIYYMEVAGDYYFDEFLKNGGAKNDKELINFITSNITKGLLNMTLKESDINCSAITATTAEGDRVFGRNYDFAKTNTCIVYTHPGNGRHASYSTVDLQFLGIDQNADVGGLMDKITCLAAPYAPLDGVNDAGVSCGIFMSYQGTDDVVATSQNTDKPDLTSTTMLRLVLDYADSVEEAVELIQTYDLHDSANTSFHYMLADATGRSAILEWVNDPADATADNDGSARKLNVIWNDADPLTGATDWQCITNFLVTPGYYDNGGKQNGLDRYELLRDTLTAAKGQVADEAAAMDVMALVGRRGWQNENPDSITVHSVVYNLTDKTVLWVGNEHYGEEKYTFRYQLK